jgi:hypothetical protein
MKRVYSRLVGRKLAGPARRPARANPLFFAQTKPNSYSKNDGGTPKLNDAGLYDRRPGESMYRLAMVLLVGLLLAGESKAQKSAAEMREEAAQAELHRQEVSMLEREMAHALQLSNSTFYQRVFGDDFVGTNEHGQTISKPAVIRGVQDPDTKYISVVASDVRVRFFQDTAIVQALWSMRGTQNGQNFSRQLRVIHVYISGPRGWQVVAGQQTALPGRGAGD